MTSYTPDPRYVAEPIGMNARAVRRTHLHAVKPWKKPEGFDAERFYDELGTIGENMQHVADDAAAVRIENKPPKLTPSEIDDCVHEWWKVCFVCGLDDGQIEEDF